MYDVVVLVDMFPSNVFCICVIYYCITLSNNALYYTEKFQLVGNLSVTVIVLSKYDKALGMYYT